jgi:excisionase family DNA binding protein
VAPVATAIATVLATPVRLVLAPALVSGSRLALPPTFGTSTCGNPLSCLSIGRSHCYQLVMRGEIASIKLGRSRRIPVTALEQFVRERLEREREVASGCEDAEGGSFAGPTAS